jgi:predicted ribosome quality control (RQC) complex YloA/Tae2 family protein
MRLTSRGSYVHHHDVSKTLQYDSLLVRALVAALDERYAGARVRAIRFDAETRSVRVCFPRRALVWDLDPAAGGLWQEPERGVPTGVILPRRTILQSVRAAPDERIVEWILESGEDGTRIRRLWVELLPNRRNAILTGEDSRVLGSLLRVSSDGKGPPVWTPPQPGPRAGLEAPPDEAAWLAALGDVEPESRERVLLSSFAWTGPINAGPILGDASRRTDRDVLIAAYRRYVDLLARQTPGIVEPGHLDQPYPAPLPGLRFRGTGDLLAAFEETAPLHRTRAGEQDPAEVLRTLERLRNGERSKIDRLQNELAGAGREAERLRSSADLLLGQLHRVRRGMTAVTLDDWAGGEVRLKLDPALDPAANARRLYDRARKRERAADRLPGLIARSEARVQRLEDAVRTLEADPSAVEEVSALIPASAPGKQRPQRGPALPYRRYRTSGGLEVRVGRGSRANDELTLHHSRPDDIWLHARDVAGAHVVLRWDRREENPPAADVAEAAALAALHSRARTSGVVPVDWTRRKYVRKPRKAPPGQVTLERARTVFVEPDASLEERLRHA